MSVEPEESHPDKHLRNITSSDARLRKIASWVVMFGTMLLASYVLGFLIYHSLRPTTSSGSWFITILERQFAATLGVPLSAIASVCIILMLKTTATPIEFEGLGFKFRGASGPIVLWVLCFLSMILALPPALETLEENIFPGRVITKACSGRAISMSLMQGLSLAAVRARR